jgi:ABC-2 type transport system permease protein
MTKVFLIAKREFLATVATRAFIIGLLILPAMIAVFVLIAPRIFSNKNYQVRGELLVIDPTGRIATEMRKAFDSAKIALRREEEARTALSNMPKEARQLTNKAIGGSIARAMGPIPEIQIVERPADSNIEQQKVWLNAQPKNMPHLAFIVIHKDAIEPSSLGSNVYDIYVPPNLDDRAVGEIQRSLREAILNARFQARSMDKSSVDAVLSVPSAPSVTVTQNNQRQTVQGFNFLLPAVFGFLLFMGIMGGGGQLLSSTVEEKSSRVVEVLLSAVSPMELMTGKLIGQFGISLVGMGLYIVLGIALLAGFALLGFLNFSLIFYLIIFFLITYLVMGSLMMSIGAAVNDIKEAQSLMMPLTLIFMVPWFLWMPISRDPNSALSITVSFIPPVNTFAMMLRMASNTPPPLWQVWISIGIGIASAYGAVWFASKVFRIGLLMYGKAPDFRTLIRWVRSA